MYDVSLGLITISNTRSKRVNEDIIRRFSLENETFVHAKFHDCRCLGF